MKPSALRVLNILRAHNGEWVAGSFFVNNYCFAYSQRIGELRKLGYEIQSERAPVSEMNRYRLIGEKETNL